MRNQTICVRRANRCLIEDSAIRQINDIRFNGIWRTTRARDRLLVKIYCGIRHMQRTFQRCDGCRGCR